MEENKDRVPITSWVRNWIELETTKEDKPKTWNHRAWLDEWRELTWLEQRHGSILYFRWIGMHPADEWMTSGQNNGLTFGSEFQAVPSDERYWLGARNRMRNLVVERWLNEEDVDEKGRMDAKELAWICDFPRLKKIFNRHNSTWRVDGTCTGRSMRECSFCLAREADCGEAMGYAGRTDLKRRK